MLQVPIRVSVYRRLRVEAARRDLKAMGPVADEILDAALPPLAADANEESEEQPEPKRRKTA